VSNILIPGDELRLRVASVPQSADDYRRVGNWNAEIIEAEFERHGVILADVGSLLDFGCGCGRTLQFLRERAPHVILHGSDIDEAAIAWCRETIPYARCDINQAVPPLNYADASFDAIIALSVFSHLDASMERQWFAELGRVLKPGGLLLISFSGPFVLEHYRDEYSPENLAEYEQTGFTFVRNITDGLFPAWYQTSLQNVAFIGKSLPEGLRIAGYLEQGLTGWQDLVMIRRNSDANRLTGAPVATSRSVAAARPTPPFAPALDSIGAALAAPDSQAALRDAMFDAWRMMCADTGAPVRRFASELRRIMTRSCQPVRPCSR
jgi:SAM-dependent methyltransferase